MKRIIRDKTRRCFEYVSSDDELYQFVRYLKEKHCFKEFNALLRLNGFNKMVSFKELFKLKIINAIGSIDVNFKFIMLTSSHLLDFKILCNENMVTYIHILNQMNEITYKRQNNILYKIINKCKNLMRT